MSSGRLGGLKSIGILSVRTAGDRGQNDSWYNNDGGNSFMPPLNFAGNGIKKMGKVYANTKINCIVQEIN